MLEQKQERLHIFFSGSVQGVGFRYTTRYLANKYNLKGWVKNLFDGRVELLVQGEREEINLFLEDLRNEFKGYIINEEREWLVPLDDLTDFNIRF
ncbi:MAG: acylphosphatase [Candidatus Omnitrophica bacterium]|nr:acylphosphatase [Candidatus Omnitrophota bacterium]MCM8826495.1 acylphosphatase [Candidatus Omnitrophota bacterium]